MHNKDVAKVIYLAIIGIFLIFQTKIALTQPSQGAWGIFHYFISAKYSKEVGYFNLYTCALKTGSPNLQDIKLVRDLKTYRLVSVDKLPPCPMQNFSYQRWEGFVKDVNYITAQAPTFYWESAFLDKGFNPPPFWTAVAGFASNTIPVTNWITYLIVFNLDLVFIVLASFIIAKYSSIKLGLITFLLSIFYFGTQNALANNYLQYAWFPMLAGSFVLWQKKKFTESGALLGFASGLQVFPIIFSLPVILLFISALFYKQSEAIKNGKRFLIPFFITLLFCFFISCIYAGNISNWHEWYTKITIHKNYLPGEIFNIGLKNLEGSLLSPTQNDSYSYREDYSQTHMRNQVLEILSPITNFITIILFLLITFILVRTKPSNPFVFGYFYMYIFLTLSPYYYLSLALLPYFFWDIVKRLKLTVLWGTILIFSFNLLLFWNGGYVSFVFFKHVISEISIFLFYSIVLFLYFLESKNTKNKAKKIGISNLG